MVHFPHWAISKKDKSREFGWHGIPTVKKSEIEWKNDQMYGAFQTWHDNGKIRVIGQTTDGEVDGVWKEFYENGSLEAHSENKIGTLVNIEVFLLTVRSATNQR